MTRGTFGTTTRTLRWVLSCIVPLLGAGACWPAMDPLVDGECAVLPESVLDCQVAGYDGMPKPAGLVGYRCTGHARPDDGATMTDGVPSGLLCADKGPLQDGSEAYCCTESEVTCAYDPTYECDSGNAGYECWGNNRPESLNPALLCSNGTSERDLYRYCCAGRPELSPPPCEESAAAGCGNSLLGFMCRGDMLPRGENYGPNRSRADLYYPVCSVARPAPNPELNRYCCFMNLTIPVGGSCYRQPTVPGCEPGRFAFACYGPDNPEDNYPPIRCPDPGFSGISDEGYDAKLYCCDFE